MSNVPATLLIAPLGAGSWTLLLYAANAGGCGTLIASMANLLGWQIYQRNGGNDPRFLWRFTAINVLLLLVIGSAGWLLIRWRAG